MPNRVIKESICESTGLSECSLFSDDLFKRLITYADDYGRFNSDTTIMRARLYPREYEYVLESDIIEGLIELCGVGKITFYTTQHFGQFKKKSGVYGALPNWKDHQRVRDSKAKCPEPDDTSVNDWYLRRFISMDMKVAIVDRDNFKCQECGKFLTSCRDAKRFVKLGQGLFHIDHIVPVQNGGRATLENLRLTCPDCNLKRKKAYTFQEIVDFTISHDSAASCGELRQNAAIIQSNPNPIRIQSEGDTRAREAAGTSAPISGPGVAIHPTFEQVLEYAKFRGAEQCAKPFFDYYSAANWRDGQNIPVYNWQQKFIAWQMREEEKQKRSGGRAAGKGAFDPQPTQKRIQENNEWLDTFLEEHRRKEGDKT